MCVCGWVFLALPLCKSCKWMLLTATYFGQSKILACSETGRDLQQKGYPAVENAPNKFCLTHAGMEKRTLKPWLLPSVWLVDLIWLNVMFFNLSEWKNCALVYIDVWFSFFFFPSRVSLVRQDAARFRDNAMRTIVGSVVLTRYNNKTYRVDDIAWDMSPNNKFVSSGSKESISFIEYYRYLLNVFLLLCW